MSTTAFRCAITRDVITATGKDARTFLHSQLSNDITGLKPGAVTHAFILDPNGKLNAFFRVRCIADDHFVLDVDAGCGDSAVARLNKFKIRVQCNFELRSEVVTAVRGLTAGACADLLALPGAVAAWRAGDGAVDILGAMPSLVQAIRSGSDAEYHEERVRCAWPLFGVDITEASLPAETGLIDVAVSFTKGCYPGQELVERMDSRGSTAPRTLMRLPARMAAQTPGDVRTLAMAGRPYMVVSDGNIVDIGTCTSVAGEYALVLVARAHIRLADAMIRPAGSSVE